jgi:predicted nucleic acid-binding protein
MIVLDASTLIVTAKVELLDLFLANVSIPVAIPSEAARECCGSKKALDAALIQKALDESLIKTIAVKDRRLVAKLRGDFSLGKGEAEAIVLAAEQKAQLLGIDDKNGINACKLLGLAFTTTVGILLRSRGKGLLEEAEALEKLTQLARYGRYGDSIIEDARRKLEAKP